MRPVPDITGAQASSKRVPLDRDSDGVRKRHKRGGANHELEVGDRIKYRETSFCGYVREIDEAPTPRLVKIEWLDPTLDLDGWVEEDTLVQVTSNSKPVLNWQVLEKLLRNIHEWREYYIEHGIEEIELDGGYVVNFHDLLRGIDTLPPRQREALILTCIDNLKEEEAAELMGFTKWSSPVGTYKKMALKRLLERYWK